MKLTKKALQEGRTITEGNISIKLTNNAYLVKDHTGNWYGFETYKEAKEEYNKYIKTSERLKLQ